MKKIYYKPRILRTYRKHVRTKNGSWINRKPTAWHAIRSMFRLWKNFDIQKNKSKF